MELPSKINLSSPILDFVLYLIVLFLFPFGLIFSLYYPNVILEQGLAHRIFYFHVSVAWVALYSPILSSFFGILYLFSKKQVFDTLGFSMNKMAMLFSLFVLISGPIWAGSAWGTYWDWSDARLQSFFVLLLCLFAYFIFRSQYRDYHKRSLYSAVLSIFCALNSLLTWGAIRWIDNPGNHPGSVLGKGGMDPDMKTAFWINILSYHFLFFLLFILVYRNDSIMEKLVQIRETVED